MNRLKYHRSDRTTIYTELPLGHFGVVETDYKVGLKDLGPEVTVTIKSYAPHDALDGKVFEVGGRQIDGRGLLFQVEVDGKDMEWRTSLQEAFFAFGLSKIFPSLSDLLKRDLPFTTRLSIRHIEDRGYHWYSAMEVVNAAVA